MDPVILALPANCKQTAWAGLLHIHMVHIIDGEAAHMNVENKKGKKVVQNVCLDCMYASHHDIAV